MALSGAIPIESISCPHTYLVIGSHAVREASETDRSEEVDREPQVGLGVLGEDPVVPLLAGLVVDALVQLHESQSAGELLRRKHARVSSVLLASSDPLPSH